MPNILSISWSLSYRLPLYFVLFCGDFSLVVRHVVFPFYFLLGGIKKHESEQSHGSSSRPRKYGGALENSRQSSDDS